MRDLPQAVARLNLEPMGLGEDAGSLHRPAHGRSVEGGDRLPGKPRREAPRLLAAFLRESHVGLAGEGVLRRENSRAVPDEVDAGGHGARSARQSKVQGPKSKVDMPEIIP